MKSILCPIDFSPASVSALNYAAGMAQQLQISLTVLHIYELPVLYGDAPYLAMQQLTEEIRNTAQQNLDRAVSTLKKTHPSIQLNSILRNGIPVSEILDESTGNDVIVMGTKGLSTIERLLIGSTTERVFHHSVIPVLCIPADASFNGISQIIFATDLQEDNLNAAKTVISFASAFNSEVRFIYINRENSEAHDFKEEELTEKMQSRFDYKKIAGTIVDDDDISKGIQSFLSGSPADILCMFTHERSFPRALLMPSVTSKALHHLHIPLLVLHKSGNKES